MSLSVRNTAPSQPYVFESYAGDVPANPVAYATGEDSRAEGDKHLAHSIGPAPFAHPLSGPDSLFNIPAHSTLGVWLRQLDSALRHPDFKRWMTTQGISPSNVQFDPQANTLDMLIKGQPKRFSLNDDSGFSAVAGPLIQAVRTLGFWPASSGRFLDYASKPYNVAHFEDVLRFYGVNPTAPPAHYQAFSPIEHTDALRGDTALAEQQRGVGDIHDRSTLLAQLTRLLAKLPAPPVAPSVLSRDLGALKISVHPGSTYSQAHPSADHTKVSAAHFIAASGAPVPKTLEALKKLIRTLRNDPLEQARAAREKNRYSQLMRKTHHALPIVREEAKKWAEDILFKLTGTRVDADKIYLNRFQGGGNTAPTITGWEHMYQEPWRSQTLPDALLSNFGEEDWVPGNLDAHSGLYTVGAGYSDKGGYSAHNQFPLLPSAVMHESWKTDFQAQISARLESFWNTHDDDYRATLKGEFVSQARQQLKASERTSPDAQPTRPAEQQLTRDDYRLLMKAASNVPLDENEPLTVEQLQAKTPVKDVVRTHMLDINGYVANDILRFSAADHSIQVLYIPGHQPAFLRFNSMRELDQWIALQGTQPDTRKALESHFSLRDRQDNGIGFWSDFKSFITGDRQSNTGVDTALKYLGNGFWDSHKGVVIDKGNVEVHDDIFSVIKDATQHRMASDADVVIKSNSEVTRDTWLNDVTVAAGLIAKFAVVGEPIVVGAAVGLGLAETALGTEKALSGDSQAERKQGASSALDGVLNTLFSLGGGAVDDPAAAAPRPRLAVRQEVFADGHAAQVIDHELSPAAYTLPRAEGYDLVDGDSVYRYRNSRPDELTELASAEPTDPLEGFEAVCPAPSSGGRVKRGANDECFAKIIADLPKPDAQLQALEHVRLLPSKPGLFNKARTVVYEKRLHSVVETNTGPQLVPVPNAERIIYKQQIRGKLVADSGFGFYAGDAAGELAKQTRVVKLNKISNISDDQRHVRGVVVTSGSRQYLVVEADTAEFYYAPLEKTSNGEITFKKCGPFELSLAQGYREFLALNQGAQALDKPFVALPKLSAAFSLLEKAGYNGDDLEALKALCKNLSKEQQREVVYQLQRAKAIHIPDIALNTQRVLPLEKPADFAQWPARRQNQFYAEHAKASVDKALTATGLGPGNTVRSAADLARADAAHMTVEWLRRTANLKAADAGDLIMKTGAGNCGEMALLSREIIRQSGGMAREWNAGDAHVFTVVGGPGGNVGATVDFSGAAWADAWIVDPWAGIACPAAEYTEQLKTTMARWDKAGLRIRSGAQADMSPQDAQWLDTLVNQPKEPQQAPLPAAEPEPLIPHPRVPDALPTATSMEGVD